MSNFANMDLNLLLTLDALLTEHNVTRAAQRLHLSQPSVSVQLAKLRDIFNDPLLLPGPRGMLPTARADELRQPLRDAIELLRLAVSPVSHFDPTKSDKIWRVSASDYGESAVLLPALKGFRIAAPFARLAIFETQPAKVGRKLELGEIDLLFHTGDGIPGGLRRRKLFDETYRLVSRVGHPTLKKNPGLDEFNQLEHVMVSPDGGGFYGITDKVLSECGLKRKVVLSVPHFLFVLSALATTDLVAMLPARLIGNNPALQIFEPPLEVPGFEMAMLWHERSHRDPAHQWLRDFFVSAL
ncbi:LysR family transcriptional regulator [Serratia sp. M24T3]|uniref:LysR family transcriptional regulator n=1 Tax=Serratia sp. M24T3 TaxID=932213 RepID=UPI00025BBA97|nr:LysR family transcriptional regulator [Serratia sp. M24T3]EIC83277.1 LysR family transcriptional regulator [Serratia sp. M24T3]